MKENTPVNTERGQSFMELAISMVLLLILLAGVVDVGRAFFTYIALRDSVQEGASYAAIEPEKCQEIIRRVREQSTQPVNLATDPNISVTVTVDGFTCTSTSPNLTAHFCPGDPIFVRIRYTGFETMMPFFSGQTFTLNAEIHNKVLMDSNPDPDSNPETVDSPCKNP